MRLISGFDFDPLCESPLEIANAQTIPVPSGLSCRPCMSRPPPLLACDQIVPPATWQTLKCRTTVFSNIASANPSIAPASTIYYLTYGANDLPFSTGNVFRAQLDANAFQVPTGLGFYIYFAYTPNPPQCFTCYLGTRFGSQYFIDPTFSGTCIYAENYIKDTNYSTYTFSVTVDGVTYPFGTPVPSVVEFWW